MRSDAIIIFGVTLAILLAMTFSSPSKTGVGQAGEATKGTAADETVELSTPDTATNIVLEGIVSLMVADDFENMSNSRTFYVLQTKDGFYELKDVKLGELKPGARYRITGTTDGKTFNAKPGGMELLDDPGVPGPNFI